MSSRKLSAVRTVLVSSLLVRLESPLGFCKLSAGKKKKIQLGAGWITSSDLDAIILYVGGGNPSISVSLFSIFVYLGAIGGSSPSLYRKKVCKPQTTDPSSRQVEAAGTMRSNTISYFYKNVDNYQLIFVQNNYTRLDSITYFDVRENVPRIRSLVPSFEMLQCCASVIRTSLCPFCTVFWPPLHYSSRECAKVPAYDYKKSSAELVDAVYILIRLCRVVKAKLI